jgi:hypothetical protein
VAAAPPGSTRAAGALGEIAGREVAVEEATDREVAVEGALAGASGRRRGSGGGRCVS